MRKFRKLPVVIEAYQFHAPEHPEEGQSYGEDGAIYYSWWGNKFYISTLESEMKVQDGDWIITGVKGEKYPCKPDIFEMTYEEVGGTMIEELKPCPFCGKEAEKLLPPWSGKEPKAVYKTIGVSNYITLRSNIGDNGCWNWYGCKNNKGYGKGHYKSRLQLAHRISYQMYFGKIPEGKVVCHKCDNPGCVNPDHLFLGTRSDNMRDCRDKGRMDNRGNALKTHCKHGHPFDKENTYVYTSGKRQGQRICRACGREYQRRKYGYKPRLP